MTNLRESNFKIGCFHGKLNPEKENSEAVLRNHLYLIGMLRLMLTKTNFIDIKILAYEMPLESRKTRGRCIDLFGYDQNKKPWIIELKKQDSNENVDEIVKQINAYAEMFGNEKVKTGIQNEIRERYHWKDFKFSDGIGKVILAGRDFYEGKNVKSMKDDIYFCSYSGISDEEKGNKVVLLDKLQNGIINLRVHNK